MIPLDEIPSDKFKHIAEEFNLELMLLFGSQVSCRAAKGSDIDVAILREIPLSNSEYAELLHCLGVIFKDFRVELTMLRHASPLLRGQIARNCKLLYEKKAGMFLRFRLSAIRQYIDASSIFSLRRKYLNQKIKKFEREIAGGTG